MPGKTAQATPFTQLETVVPDGFRGSMPATPVPSRTTCTTSPLDTLGYVDSMPRGRVPVNATRHGD